MKESLYKRIYIEGKEENLPKIVGDYHVKIKNGSGKILHFTFYGDVGYNIFKSDWCDYVEYWLKPVILPETKDACDKCVKDDAMYDDPEEMQSKMMSRKDLQKAAYDNGFLNCFNWFKSQILNK